MRLQHEAQIDKVALSTSVGNEIDAASELRSACHVEDDEQRVEIHNLLSTRPGKKHQFAHK